jgi:hypothetical protein
MNVASDRELEGPWLLEKKPDRKAGLARCLSGRRGSRAHDDNAAVLFGREMYRLVVIVSAVVPRVTGGFAPPRRGMGRGSLACAQRGGR